MPPPDGETECLLPFTAHVCSYTCWELLKNSCRPAAPCGLRSCPSLGHELLSQRSSLLAIHRLQRSSFSLSMTVFLGQMVSQGRINQCLLTFFMPFSKHTEVSSGSLALQECRDDIGMGHKLPRSPASPSIANLSNYEACIMFIPIQRPCVTLHALPSDPS